MYSLKKAVTYIFGLILMAGTIMTQDNQKLPDLGTNGVVKDILIMTFTIKNLSDSLQIEAAAREQAEKKLESCQSEKKFNVPKYENKTILEMAKRKALECATVNRSEVKVVVVSRRADYTYIEGVGSYKLYVKIKTWEEARESCILDGGHLAIIDSHTEMRHLADMLKNAEPEIKKLTDWGGLGWIGVHKEDNQWVTICEATADRFWGKKYGVQEPDNTEGDCACILSSWHSEYGMLHTTCDQKFAYICEL